MVNDQELDLADIQGNIIGGFNTDNIVLIGVTLPDAVEAASVARWLGSLHLTTAAEVRRGRAQIKLALAEATETWLGLGLGRRVLDLCVPKLQLLDNAFNIGMIGRAPGVLGDSTDPAGWKVGGTQPLDVLLIVASNNVTAVRSRARSLTEEAKAAGMLVTYSEAGQRLPREREHFGFRDGISQPDILGVDAGGTIAPGHFVFGYPQNPGGAPFKPFQDPGGIADNGSLLVFRRLAQDVAAFRAFCSDKAKQLTKDWPMLSPDLLAAKIVGRWPSGAPLAAGAVADPDAIHPGNTFDFADDNGSVCPYGAHIRKVNPRLGPRDVVVIPRILRRGIPFGPVYDSKPEAERGLLFLSYQTSIADQFEFLTQHWMNSIVNPAKGQDLLVGRSSAGRTTYLELPSGELTVTDDGRQWITPTGGAYLFAPSRIGLSRIVAGA